MTLTFPSPSPGPQPLWAALTFYILSMKIVISLRLLVIPVFHYGVGVSRMDRVRNFDLHRRAGIERELVSRADQRVLRWFKHVKRMDEYRMRRMARRVLMPRKWRAGMKQTEVRLDKWCEGGQQRNDGGGCMLMLAKDRREWNVLVHNTTATVPVGADIVV